MTRPHPGNVYRRRNGEHIRVRFRNETHAEVEPVVLVGDIWTRDDERRCSTIRVDRLARLRLVHTEPRTVYGMTMRWLRGVQWG